MNHLETSWEPFYYVQHVLCWQAAKWRILLSSLMLLLNYRSTDYGTTYEKLNDKVGLKTILSYLYVCPTNKRKVRPVYSTCCLFMTWFLSCLASLSSYKKICYGYTGIRGVKISWWILRWWDAWHLLIFRATAVNVGGWEAGTSLSFLKGSSKEWVSVSGCQSSD